MLLNTSCLGNNTRRRLLCICPPCGLPWRGIWMVIADKEENRLGESLVWSSCGDALLRNKKRRFFNSFAWPDSGSLLPAERQLGMHSSTTKTHNNLWADTYTLAASEDLQARRKLAFSRLLITASCATFLRALNLKAVSVKTRKKIHSYNVQDDNNATKTAWESPKQPPK